MREPQGTKQAPIPNPNHRRQVLLQIALPLTAFILLVITAGVVSTMAMSSPMVTKWSHLSTIYMVLISALFGLAALAILAALIFALAKLLSITPLHSRTVQGFFFNISVLSRVYADKVVEPVLKFKSWWSGLASVFKR